MVGLNLTKAGPLFVEYYKRSRIPLKLASYMKLSSVAVGVLFLRRRHQVNLLPPGI